jgi:hypothetical protein
LEARTDLYIVFKARRQDTTVQKKSVNQGVGLYIGFPVTQDTIKYKYPRPLKIA